MSSFKIYSKSGRVKSDIKRECTQVGESLEEMIRRCTESNEPIDSTAPMIYTEEADGVQPQFDPRSDRFDIALEAVDKYNKSMEAKKQEEAARAAAEAQSAQEGNGDNKE